MQENYFYSLSNKQRVWLRRTLAHSLKSTFVIPAVGAGLLISAAALPARAIEYHVVGATGVTDATHFHTLADAITDLNIHGGVSNSIQFDETALVGNLYSQTNDLPMITKSVDIDATGVTLDANQHRAFMFGDGVVPITVNINGLTIMDAKAQGGNGSDGGGGAAGLGGAVFVNSNADVTLNSVYFKQNTAQGGNGGASSSGGGGGGGGLQENGEVSSDNLDGGDGGNPNGGVGGDVDGGGGGYGGDGSIGGFGGGGGGGGGGIYGGGGSGGTGGFGGGGGGGAVGTFGGDGGNGGFGGGGGGGGAAGGDGGSGGYGGSYGHGGTFGGNSIGGYGGGGAGFGGAVFVRNGGNLTIAGETTINDNSVAGGSENLGGAAGSGIFLNGKDLTIGSSTDESTFTTTINDNIADSSSGIGTYTETGAGGITKNGAGTLVLGGHNTFTGGSTLADGTVDIVNNDSLGTGDVTVAGPDNIKTLNYVTDGLNINNKIILNDDVNLNVDGDNSATQSGIISGNGGITKTGGGTLILTSENNTYYGDTNVNEGILENTGILRNTNVIANAGATFHNVFVDSQHKGYVYQNATASGEGSKIINDSYVLGNATASGKGSTFENNLYISGDALAIDGGSFDNTYNTYPSEIVGNATSDGEGSTFNNYGQVDKDGAANNGGYFYNDTYGFVTGHASADGAGSVFDNSGIVGNNNPYAADGEGASATNGGTFNNGSFGAIAGDATVSGIGSTFNNSGGISGDASVSGAGSVFNNNGGYMDGGATISDGGSFYNNGYVYGNATVSGDESTFEVGTGGVIGSATINSGALNANDGLVYFGSLVGGGVQGGVILTETGNANVGNASVSGDGSHASGANDTIYRILETNDPYGGNGTVGVSNNGSGNFTIGSGNIGSVQETANGNDVFNTLNYYGIGNAVQNSGNGTFAVGHNTIYGNDNVVTNSVATFGVDGHFNPVPTGFGNILQTGTGNVIIGGADIHGDGNHITNNVGNITATNGAVKVLFNTLHSNGNISEENLGHQDLSGGAVGHYGDTDVTLPADSNNNSDTITINGIDVDGTTANIGGGSHDVQGDHNNYQVIVNTQDGDDNAISLTDGATAVLSGGDNTITGSHNNFANTVNGNVSVDGSTFVLDAGTIATPDDSANSNNSSGNTINGNVSLVNSGEYTDGGMYIYGQTTDVASGTNSAFNIIKGSLNATDSYIQVSGHNNTVEGDVNLINDWEQSGLVLGQFDNITNSLPQTLENSLQVNGTVTTGGYGYIAVAAGGIALTGDSNTITNKLIGDVTLNGGSVYFENQVQLQGDNNHIINTIDGTLSGVNTWTVIDQYNDSYVTGQNNVLSNELTQDLAFTDGAHLRQSSEMDFTDAQNNQINNIVTGAITINGPAAYVWQGGETQQVDANSSNNHINNTIIGNVTVTGQGSTLAQGGGFIGDTYSASDANGNQITNLIDGQVIVEDDASFFIDGERNIVTKGVTTTSSSGTHIGIGPVGQGNQPSLVQTLDAVETPIYNESTADHTVTGGGHLHIGSSAGDITQTVNGDNFHVTNRVIGDASQATPIQGTITVIGAGSTLGLGDGLHDSDHGGLGDLDITGAGNIIDNYVGDNQSTGDNHLDAQLQTVTDGGKVLLGGRNIFSTGTGNVVNNTVDQDVTLGNDASDFAYLELAGTGASSTVGDNAATVNNTVIGNVIANGGSEIFLNGSNGANAFNKITGSVNLNNNAQLTVMNGSEAGGGNVVTGGINLNGDRSIVSVGGAIPGTNNLLNNSLNGDIHFQNSKSIVAFGANLNNAENRTNTITNSHYGMIDSGDGLGGTVFLTNIINASNNNGVSDNNNSITTNQVGDVVLTGSDSSIYMLGRIMTNNTNNSSGTNDIANSIIGNVDVTDGSVNLGNTNAFSITAGNGINTITNTITGTVTLHNAAQLNFYGDDGSSADNTLTNEIQTSASLHDTSQLFATGGGNIVSDGITLLDNSRMQLSALSEADQSSQNEINADINLYNSSTIIWGNNPNLASNPTMVANNRINGNIITDVNSAATLKVLSGGSGGANSASGLNTINGDLALNNKSTFVVNTDGSISTGLQVDGDADLGSATLFVNYNGDTAPTLNQKMSLVEAIDGRTLSNGFSNDTIILIGDQDFLRKYRVQTGVENNMAYLEFLNRLFALSGTRNQQSFQRYLNNLLENTDTIGINNLLDLLNNSDNPNIFNNFLGDSYSAFDMIGYQNASNFAHAVAEHAKNPLYSASGTSGNNPMYELNFADNGAQRLSGVGAQLTLVQQMLNPRPVMQLAANGNNNDSSLWGSVSGHWLHNESDSTLGSPDWSQNSKSVTLGYQGGDNSFSWGITGGYHDGTINFNNRSADGDNDGWNAGLNALWQSKSHTYVNGVLTYGHESNSLTRNDGLGTNKADFDAKSYSALLEVGKRIDRKTFSFTPYASLLGVKYDRDAFTESGSGAGLSVDGESHSYLTSTLGVRISRTFLDESGQTRGGVMLGASYQHQFSGTEFPVTASLNGAMGSSSFTTYGTPLSSNSLGIQLGGYGRITNNLYGFLNYSGNFGGEQKVNSVTAGLQYGF